MYIECYDRMKFEVWFLFITDISSLIDILKKKRKKKEPCFSDPTILALKFGKILCLYC